MKRIQDIFRFVASCLVVILVGLIFVHMVLPIYSLVIVVAMFVGFFIGGISYMIKKIRNKFVSAA